MEKVDKGVSESVVRQISEIKQEPDWMLDLRLSALKIFEDTEIPQLGYKPLDEKLRTLDFSDLNCYISPDGASAHTWDDVPLEVKAQYDKLGVPESERPILAGLGAQIESEMIYHSLKNDLKKQGVIFLSMGEAVKQKPELIKKYFGSLIKPSNNKFAALNQAMWSGGSFVYIPKGVNVKAPLHNFYKMSLASQGQFERTLIIADDDSSVEFLEGCVAPQYVQTSLHAGVVEIFVNDRASVRYITMQNWSKNIWNLVTKQAKVGTLGSIEWIDGNVGSGITMKYPALRLEGDGAKGQLISLSLIGEDQIIDSGAKVFHVGEGTISNIMSKTILKSGGKSNFRAFVDVKSSSINSQSRVECSSLFLDNNAESQTLPKLNIRNSKFQMEHESSLFKLRDDQLTYLMSRGFSKDRAISFMLGGFVAPFIQELPMEYAVEFDQLIEIESND